MLAYGKGCTQDMDKAFSWYRGAAEANETTACFIMGELMQIAKILSISPKDLINDK